jgi:hypothetical protein
VQKECEKAWHEKHIKQNNLQMGDLVLIYDNNFLQHPRKFQMHWLGPYVIILVTEAVVIQLEELNGETMEGIVNDSRLKLYRDSRASTHYSE